MAKGLSFSAVTVLHAIARGFEYGFDIIDDTGLPSGTVYPALSRLERDGYLRSDWEDVQAAHADKRPPRRYYRITALGVRALDAAVRRYRALAPVRPVSPARGRG
jgi:PadR family transcriptional regulator, regulatory protein PadR